MAYKTLHGLCRENFLHKFVQRVVISEYRTTIDRGDLQIPNVQQEYTERSFCFPSVKNWNGIPDSIPGLKSLALHRGVTSINFLGGGGVSNSGSSMVLGPVSYPTEVYCSTAFALQNGKFSRWG